MFFVHPTSYLNRAHWIAPLDDAEANARAALFLRGQASAFNEVGEVWAPRYRQATFGAFLTSAADAQAALDFAYRDVAAAFDAFLAAIPKNRPIILAGHSQGALHLTHLLRDRVATDPPPARRIVAAYVVGWPISTATDPDGAAFELRVERNLATGEKAVAVHVQDAVEPVHLASASVARRTAPPSGKSGKSYSPGPRMSERLTSAAAASGRVASPVWPARGGGCGAWRAPVSRHGAEIGRAHV